MELIISLLIPALLSSDKDDPGRKQETSRHMGMYRIGLTVIYLHDGLGGNKSVRNVC